MSGQFRYRLKIRKAGNIVAGSSIVQLKFAKIRLGTNLQIATLFVHIIINGKIQFAEASVALQHQSRQAPQDAHTLRQLFLYDNCLEVDLPPVLEGSDCFIFV